MVQELANKLGAFREKREKVAKLGFMDGKLGNVATAFSATGEALFDFAWRPHEIGKDYVTKEGLFLC